jgi:hypothetical protein
LIKDAFQLSPPTTQTIRVEQLGQLARKTVEDGFTVDDMIEHLTGLYEGVLRKSQRASERVFEESGEQFDHGFKQEGTSWTL